MSKIDYKKELKHLYSATTKQSVVTDVPVLNYLMIDGIGNPNSAVAYKDAVEALYSLSYAIKFVIKKNPLKIDYVVMPLEGLWWMDDMSQFSVARKDEWKWTLMIMQPSAVTRTVFDCCVAEVAQKKKLPALTKVAFKSFHEGQSVQILHVGPFSEEGPTIERLHASIAARGAALAGKHHEIYLSDIRRAKPEKWKTIIRQPFTQADNS